MPPATVLHHSTQEAAPSSLLRARTGQDLKEVLGNDLGGILESALVQKGLRPLGL